MQDKIPKIIHYCWFGGKELPDSARKCIASWKKYCPDYEIIEWNENNFDLHSCRYVREAYEAKKWAFVSDYARFDILYRYGGIYFDTDVELIRPIDDIAGTGSFMGMEESTNADGKNHILAVNPGLGMGMIIGCGFIRQILDGYRKDSFLDSGIHKTVVDRVTGLCKENGWKVTKEIQQIEDIYIYPPEYFSPIDNMTGKITITDNTRSIHHYDATWMKKSGKISIGISRRFADTGKLGHAVGVALSIPFRLVNKMR